MNVQPGGLRAELEARFGPEALESLPELLALSPLLAKATLFLVRHAGDLPELIELSHADPNRLLNAATIKEERG